MIKENTVEFPESKLRKIEFGKRNFWNKNFINYRIWFKKEVHDGYEKYDKWYAHGWLHCLNTKTGECMGISTFLGKPESGWFESVFRDIEYPGVRKAWIKFKLNSGKE